MLAALVSLVQSKKFSADDPRREFLPHVIRVESLRGAMQENIKIQLDCLSNSELIARLEDLVLKEKETTTEIIRHLAEVDSRRLYATLGYSSLFDYVTKKLGYSKSAAMRRISVARAGVKLPDIFSYLEDEKVTLSSLDACSGLLHGENGSKVLEELQGKSREEAEWLAAAYQPVRAARDKVEKIFVGVAPTDQPNLFTDKNSNEFRCGTNIEEKYKLSFSANPEFMDKLKRVQELMFTGKAEDLALEKIFGDALELVIEKYCPKERQQRREVRQAKKDVQPSKQSNQSNPRYIPVWLRDEVLKRDNYQCTYLGYQGHKCGCPIGLEIDHIVPFARGGKTEIENLRVLCSTHNLLAGMKVFGTQFIEEKIKEARG
jgi:5-methylcytosine-specific restriction endonuclease McrA